MFAPGSVVVATVAAVRAVVVGFRTAPTVPLESPEAGIFRGMRPVFVVAVLVPLAVAVVVVWSGVR